ncbi:glucose-1-phosphate thymidylyltransferase RfbA [Bacillus paramycoides]|uniref:glucose-1-phosphate thymidylyltransferase RfbA n=1 Tax=Bacillus paramycoides TaxID=2026194 RepID=UPI002E23B413|nr:glucose-1-phosphate thymidylyltransferase RfbA [Bacillus paramycoides]MED0961837.1 glucose-1-phosphate thymidylyltransferase RfbA [Bacillus paramycoides]
MKGIIMAGGNGTRLYPCTKAASKHLISIYDKPMIYYPLSTLMLSGIREILIISTKRDIPMYQSLLGDGKHLGLSIEYKEQEDARGIAEAFLLGESFIGDDSVCLILGDNIFYGDGFSNLLRRNTKLEKGAVVFGYRVNDPERYGVVEFDENFNVISLEEKPEIPKSNYAIPGIYFYDNTVIKIAKELLPSDRGELEITDINKEYLKRNQLIVEIIGRGSTWLDTGTPESLLDAINYVGTLEKRQGLKMACLEEISYRMGYISVDQLSELINHMPKGPYKNYIKQFIENQYLKSVIIL